ncbi:hypothetical protein D046_8015A, partial [Vibrio parahaemolyticus V-223/04]
MSLRL